MPIAALITTRPPGVTTPDLTDKSCAPLTATAKSDGSLSPSGKTSGSLTPTPL